MRQSVALFGFVLLSAAALAQQGKPVFGNVKSSSPLTIGGTSMSPLAAGWPVVDGDEVTAAAHAILSADGNRMMFDGPAKFLLHDIEGGRIYVYLRQGGVAFESKTQPLYVCAANRLFAVAPQSTGFIRLTLAGTVVRQANTGRFAEDARHACSEKGPGGLVTALQPGAPGIAGGTAAGSGTAAAGASGVATAVAIGVAAGTIGIGSAAATAGSSATASSGGCPATGCNFNPPPVSPSQP